MRNFFLFPAVFASFVSSMPVVKEKKGIGDDSGGMYLDGTLGNHLLAQVVLVGTD
jgi:hypothetical protein